MNTVSWDAAVDCLHDAEMLDNILFSLLNVLQLAIIPSIKHLHCISDYIICQEFNLDKYMQDTVSAIRAKFPVVCVKSDQHYVLIDYTGLFTVKQNNNNNNNIVHQVMVLDKMDDPEQTSAEEPGIAEIDQGILNAEEIPQLLTVKSMYEDGVVCLECVWAYDCMSRRFN